MYNIWKRLYIKIWTRFFIIGTLHNKDSQNYAYMKQIINQKNKKIYIKITVLYVYKKDILFYDYSSYFFVWEMASLYTYNTH